MIHSEIRLEFFLLTRYKEIVEYYTWNGNFSLLKRILELDNSYLVLELSFLLFKDDVVKFAAFGAEVIIHVY